MKTRLTKVTLKKMKSLKDYRGYLKGKQENLSKETKEE